MSKVRVVRHWADVQNYVTIGMACMCITQIIMVTILSAIWGSALLLLILPLTVALVCIIQARRTRT